MKYSFSEVRIQECPSLSRWVNCTARRLRCAAFKRRRWDKPLSLEEKVRLLSRVDVFESLIREESEKVAHRA
jgi:hypothetical protein